MILFIFVIVLILFYVYYYYEYKVTIDKYSEYLKYPKYFFMQPKLFFIFMNIYDIRHYNKKAFYEAIQSCDNFCNTLFVLNIDENWNNIAENYSSLNKEEKMNVYKIKCLFEKLKETRLETLNTLESMFINILPKQILTEKLKNTILELNEVLLNSTEQEYVKKGFGFTEFKPEPFHLKNKEQAMQFFIN